MLFQSTQSKAKIALVMLLAVIALPVCVSLIINFSPQSKKLLYENLELLYICLTDNNAYNPGPVKAEKMVAHAGGEIDGLTYTNSLEALNRNYKKGYRFFELDFEWTRDQHLVLLHDWESSVPSLFSVRSQQYSLAEFKGFQMKNRLTQISFAELRDWLKNHPDAYIITDIKTENENALSKISRGAPELRGRFIPQIYWLKEYKTARALGFDNIIVTLYAKNYFDGILLKFLKYHPVTAVTMPVGRARTSLPQSLRNQGIFVYVHTINDQNLLTELAKNKVDGFYTDSVLP